MSRTHEPADNGLIARHLIAAVRIDAATTENIQFLAELASDDQFDSETRRLAALRLARMGDAAADAAVPVLIDQLAFEDSEVDAVALWTLKALATFGPSAAEASPTLITLLDHQNADVRNGAIEAIARIGVADPRSIPAIRMQLTRLVRQPSLGADGQLSMQYLLDTIGSIGAAAGSCLPVVIRSLDSPYERIRAAAARCIAAFGPSADVAVSSLIERMVSDESAEVRDAASDALVEIGPSAVRSLGRLLQLGEPRIQERVIYTLGGIGPSARAVLPHLIESVENAKSPSTQLTAALAVHQVSAGGVDVGATLLRLLSHPKRQLRTRTVRLCTQVLRERQDPDLLAELQKLVKSGNRYARQAASKVLRDLSGSP